MLSPPNGFPQLFKDETHTMKKTLALSCALVLAGLSTSALAAGGQGFVRGEIGNTDVEFDVSGFGSESDDDSSYSLRGGYYFTDNIGVEAFYSDFYGDSEAGSSFDLTGYGIGAVGKWNFSPDNIGFFISGRAGFAHLKGELDDNVFGSFSESSNKPYYGVGVGYDFNEMFGLSLNYDFYQADLDDFDTDIDAESITLGGELRF